jgi:hypothetical protein
MSLPILASARIHFAQLKRQSYDPSCCPYPTTRIAAPASCLGPFRTQQWGSLKALLALWWVTREIPTKGLPLHFPLAPAVGGLVESPEPPSDCQPILPYSKCQGCSPVRVTFVSLHAVDHTLLRLPYSSLLHRVHETAPPLLVVFSARHADPSLA